VAIDGDAYVVQGLARTYDAIPLDRSPAIGTLVQGAQVAFSGIFVSAFEIAAPVLVALTITDATLGVVSRVVPQLNIFATGFPAKMLVGLSLIGVSLPFVSGFVGNSLETTVLQALHSLHP
jgi:flagellar biosynthetic protein FliR